ncbi:hypothetical protein BTR22_05265 [Alkalihalophilus pseudofirmus]|nr:hypothetical protein BTR22_05265 [Alkalihalophilus pseudofirmus]
MNTINKDYFFCYNSNLAKHLKSKGIYSITTAIQPTSQKMFTLFPKSERLQSVLDEYREQQSTNK